MRRYFACSFLLALLIILPANLLMAQVCVTGLGGPESGSGLSATFITKEYSQGLGASVWAERPTGFFVRAGAGVLRPRGVREIDINVDAQFGQVLRPMSAPDLTLCPTAHVGVGFLEGARSWRASWGVLGALPLDRRGESGEIGVLAGGRVEVFRTSFDASRLTATSDMFGSFDLGAYFRFSNCLAAALIGQAQVGAVLGEPSLRVQASLCI